MSIFDKFVSYLDAGRTEGVILFLISTLIMLLVQIYHMKEWKQGLKGTNGQWESPEILCYICFWIFPPMIFSSGFLKVAYPDLAWYSLMAFMAYGLTGRWGMEWLLAFRSGSNQVITSSTTEKIVEKVKTEEKKAEA